MSASDIMPEFADVDFDSPDAVDVLEKFDRLLAAGKKVVVIPYQEAHAYAVLGYEAVQAAFMNEAELPGATYFRRFTTEFFGRVVAAMEGDEHRFHRAVFGAPLTPAQMRNRVQGLLGPIANDLIDSFDPPRQLDFVASFARPYPFRVISTLLDIPLEDQPRLQDYVERLFHLANVDEVKSAQGSMNQYLGGLVAARRVNPGDDVISKFATTVVGGQRFSDEELLDSVRFIYPAAGENTRNALSAALYHVLADPEIYRRVRDNPADRNAAVDEALRIEPPLPYMPRYTDRPLMVEGVQIPAESFVLLCIATANRDPTAFGDPSTFSLDRGAANHLTFGRGPHFCLGAHLARAEVRTMLDLVLGRLKGLRLVTDKTSAPIGGGQRGFRDLWVEFDELSPQATGGVVAA